MFMKRRAPEPKLCHFYDGSATLVIMILWRYNNGIVTVQQWYCDGNLLAKRKILRISLLRFQSSLNPDHKTPTVLVVKHITAYFHCKKILCRTENKNAAVKSLANVISLFCFFSLITGSTKSQWSQKLFCLF